MVEEKIAEAAEALARKQLGLDKKTESEKEEKMPAMLVQISNVFNLELMEQLNKISANMMQKYNLKRISSETLDRIAGKIKDEAIDGRIESLSALSQNKEIIRFAEKEVIKRDKEEITFQSEQKNDNLLSNKEDRKTISEKFEKLKEVTDISNQIYNLSIGVTLENVDERRKKVIEIKNSEEYINAYKQFMKNAKDVIENGTEEQKKQTLAEVMRKENQRKRDSIPPEQRKKERHKINKGLFELLTLCHNDGFNDFEYVRNEAVATIFAERAFTKEEEVDLLNLINKCKNKDEISDIVLDKMYSLAKETGRTGKNEEQFKEETLKLAMSITRTVKEEIGKTEDYTREIELVEEYKDIVANNLGNKTSKLSDYYESLWDTDKKNSNTSEKLFEQHGNGIDKELCEMYAELFLESEDKEKLNRLISQIEDTERNLVHDFSILDTIKNTDKNFYHLMLRQISSVAKSTKNTILEHKIEEYIESEIDILIPSITQDTIINIRQKMTPEEQVKKRTAIIGILNTYVRENFHTDKTLDERKDGFLKYLEKEHALSEKEKIELFEKIITTTSGDELCDVMIDKMKELSKEKGIDFDKDQILKHAQQNTKEVPIQRTTARAKIIFDDQMYNQLLDFKTNIYKGLSDKNEDYDYEFVDFIKQKDSKIYGDLKENIKAILEKRKDDEKLRRLYERIEFNDKSEEYFIEETKNEKENINNRIENAISNAGLNRERNLGDKKTSTQTSVDLFKYLTQIFDGTPKDEVFLENMKNEVFDLIANDLSFSDDEKRELLKQVANSDRDVLLGNVIAEGMVGLAEKRGIPSKSLLANQIIGTAKSKNQIKNIGRGENIDRRSILQSRVYAKMFLNVKDRNEVIRLIESMSSTSKDVNYDFSILDKVKETDEAFYYTMIRTVGTMASQMGKNEFKDKYNELLATELMEKGFNDLDEWGKINTKAKIVLEEGIYNRYKKLEESIVNGSLDGLYDEQLIGYLKEKDSSIYKHLISQMEINAQNRNDKNLLDLVEKNKSEDNERESNQTEINATGKKSILTVQNLKVDEIVMNHSEGLDVFAQKHKTQQTVDDMYDGR